MPKKSVDLKTLVNTLTGGKKVWVYPLEKKTKLSVLHVHMSLFTPTKLSTLQRSTRKLPSTQRIWGIRKNDSKFFSRHPLKMDFSVISQKRWLIPMFLSINWKILASAFFGKVMRLRSTVGVNAAKTIVKG